LIPYVTFKKIAGASKIMLRKPKAKLTAYNGQDIPVTAVCNLSCKHIISYPDLTLSLSSDRVRSRYEISIRGAWMFRTTIPHRVKPGCTASFKSTQANSLWTRGSC